MQNGLTADDVELVIDDELKNCIPASSADEDKELKASIEKDGRFTDPIRFWRENGQALVVDGHRRLTVWNGLPDDTPVPPPHVEEMLFPDRAAAIQWMLLYQLSRRNLDPKRASLLRGRLYNREKKNEGRPTQPVENTSDQKRSQSGHVTQPERTVEKVAAQTHVAPRTVQRDGEYATAVEVIRDVNSKAASDIESGTLKASRQDTIAISKLPSGSVGSALRNLRNGLKWNAGLNGAAKPPKKAKSGKALNPAKLVDQLIRKQVSPLVKGIDAVAKVNGGKGPHHERASAAIDKLIVELKAMREGKQ